MDNFSLMAVFSLWTVSFCYFLNSFFLFFST